MRRPLISPLAPLARLRWLPLAALALLTIASGAAAAPLATAPPFMPASLVSLTQGGGPTALAVAADGALFTCGYLRKDVISPSVVTVTRSGGSEPGWSRTWNAGAGSDDAAIDIALAPDGSVYVAASVGDQSAYAPHPVLLKYSSSGELQWAAPASIGDYASPFKLAVDGAGHVYMCGRAHLPRLQVPFLCRFSPDGTQDWVSFYRPRVATFVLPSDLLVTPAGDTYMVGDAYVHVGTKGFVASWRADGSLRWKRIYDGPGREVSYFSALTASPSDGIYAVGHCGGLEESTWDLLVTRYRADGTRTLTRRLGVGDGQRQFAADVTTDDRGKIAVCGNWQRPGKHYYVALLRADGALVWSRGYPGNRRHCAMLIVWDAHSAGFVVAGPGSGPDARTDVYTVRLYEFSRYGFPMWTSRWPDPLPALPAPSAVPSDMAVWPGWTVSPGATVWVCGSYDFGPPAQGQMLLAWALR